MFDSLLVPGPSASRRSHQGFVRVFHRFLLPHSWLCGPPPRDLQLHLFIKDGAVARSIMVDWFYFEQATFTANLS